MSEAVKAQAPAGEAGGEGMTQETSAPTSILDMGEAAPLADAPEQAAPNGEAGQVLTENSDGNVEWSWADGLKGDGDRPAWLKDRYKSVSDQAAAYAELEKKFGEFKGAPKDGYNFEAIEGLDAQNPMLQSFSETFKELGMSQEGFERVVSEFVSSQEQMADTDMAAEMKKLGPQAKEMIGQTSQWIKNNLPADVAEVVQGWVQTADDLKALDTLRSFQPLSRSPSAADMSPAVQHESLQEVKNEKTKNWDRYQEDVNYRQSVIQRMNSAVRREEARKKR